MAGQRKITVLGVPNFKISTSSEEMLGSLLKLVEVLVSAASSTGSLQY